MTVSIPQTLVELAGDRRTIFRHIAAEQVRQAHDDLDQLPCPTLSEETDEYLDTVQQLAETIGLWGNVLTQARVNRNRPAFVPVDRSDTLKLVEGFMQTLRENDLNEAQGHNEMVALVGLLSEAKDLAGELVSDATGDDATPDAQEDCVCCGAPAAWEDAWLNPADNREALCEDCARWRGTLVHGEATGVLAMIGAGVALLRQAHLSDSAILMAVRETMADPEYTQEYSVGGLRQIPLNRPESTSWQHAFRPIEGVSTCDQGNEIQVTA